MDKTELSIRIKAEALSLGFFACGIAKADKVDDNTALMYCEWIRQGRNASMDYLRNNTDKRLNPSLLMPGVKSIVSLALSYAPEQTIDAAQPQIASYALGRDYHDVVKKLLHTLAGNLGFGEGEYRAFCDTAPVLERYWAVKSGIGWIGRNHQLIIPHAGSMFFLGELFLTVDLLYDRPVEGRCGRCRKCIDSCPTHALYEGRCSGGMDEGKNIKERQVLFDSNKCINYQTIENRGDISSDVKPFLGNSIYGCDRCQNACPWNKFARPTDISEFKPSGELLGMTREKWLNLSEDDYRRLFKGSAVKRAKYSGLMRNIHDALDSCGEN